MDQLTKFKSIVHTYRGACKKFPENYHSKIYSIVCDAFIDFDTIRPVNRFDNFVDCIIEDIGMIEFWFDTPDDSTHIKVAKINNN